MELTQGLRTCCDRQVTSGSGSAAATNSSTPGSSSHEALLSSFGPLQLMELLEECADLGLQQQLMDQLPFTVAAPAGSLRHPMLEVAYTAGAADSTLLNGSTINYHGAQAHNTERPSLISGYPARDDGSLNTLYKVRKKVACAAE